MKRLLKRIKLWFKNLRAKESTDIKVSGQSGSQLSGSFNGSIGSVNNL